MTTTATKPAGLSVWEADLLDHLTRHIEGERGLLEEYRNVAEASDAAYVTYLFELIAEEEARHHRFFDELCNALRASVEPVAGRQVPTVTSVSDREALLESTQRLLDAERADAKELRRLARRKELRLMHGHSLWPLLIELMANDTKKHQKILRFIRRQLRDSASR